MTLSEMTRQHLVDIGLIIMPIKGSLADHLDKINRSLPELKAFELYWSCEGGEFLSAFKGLLVTYGWKVNYNHAMNNFDF